MIVNITVLWTMISDNYIIYCNMIGCYAPIPCTSSSYGIIQILLIGIYQYSDKL